MSSFEEVIDRLEKKRDDLRAELTRIEQAIAALKSAAPIFKDEVELDEEHYEKDFALTTEVKRSDTVIPPSELVKLARRTLIEVGRPLKRGALVRAMEEKNIPVAGKDKAKNLGTILWRHDRQFVSLEGFGYWPRDMRYRDIYDPASPPDGIKYVDPDAA